MSPEAVTAMYARSVGDHPAKAARRLAHINASLARTDLAPAERVRLSAAAAGLAEGLAGQTRCCRCGKRLEAPHAVARGWGDECDRAMRRAAVA